MENKFCMVPMRDGTKLYTQVMLPGAGRYPVIFLRTPYDEYPDAAQRERHAQEYSGRLAKGFAVAIQHSRGRGGSEGEFQPFRNDREDGLAAIEWLTAQPWCDGSVYLEGGSYTSYVHLSYMAVLPECVRAASLSVMPTSYIKGFYANGHYKSDIAPIWYTGLYHPEDLKYENSAKACEAEWLKRPIADYARRVYGRDVPAFTRSLSARDEADPLLYEAHNYGEARDALKNVKIPVLLRDGWFEMYLEGMLAMWEELPEATRARSAFLLGPWGHSCAVDTGCPFPLPNGNAPGDPTLDWFLHVRDADPLENFREGRVNYYVIGEDEWRDAEFLPIGAEKLRLYLVDTGALEFQPPTGGAKDYTYDPERPTRFPGGANSFCTAPAGLARQDPVGRRADILSFVSQPFEAAVGVSGCAKVELTVKSDCEDTDFLARLSLVDASGDAWIMQDAIASISQFAPEYKPGEEVRLTLETCPMALKIQPGWRLRLDIASANANNYPPHANIKGDWEKAERTQVARNSVIFGESNVELPVE